MMKLNAANSTPFFYFLLQTDLLTEERMDWLFALIKLRDKNLAESLFALSGDALYSLSDPRFQVYWKNLFNLPHFSIAIDRWQLSVLGLDFTEIVDTLGIPDEKIFINDVSDNSKLDTIKNSPSAFWEAIISKLYLNQPPSLDKLLGVMQLESPYMNRSSVFSMKLLEAAQNKKINLELYCYLDGVHMGHKNQQPSEFENIGGAQEMLASNGISYKSYVCSRCATARGYVDKATGDGFYSSSSTIDSFNILNLSEIIEQFKETHPILMKSSGLFINYMNLMEFDRQKVQSVDQQKEQSSELIIVITHSPYNTEYAFGAISLGIGAASRDIKTKVIFLENGVYCLHGQHQITESDKIFNMSDIISATEDMEMLEYYAYAPSLKLRNVQINEIFEEIMILNGEDFSKLTAVNQKDGIFQRRLLFF